jgi:hypothetical protein
MRPCRNTLLTDKRKLRHSAEPFLFATTAAAITSRIPAMIIRASLFISSPFNSPRPFSLPQANPNRLWLLLFVQRRSRTPDLRRPRLHDWRRRSCRAKRHPCADIAYARISARHAPHEPCSRHKTSPAVLSSRGKAELQEPLSIHSSCSSSRNSISRGILVASRCVA